MGRYLGIDIGTQSVKAIVFDASTGQVVSEAATSLELISRGDGTREQKAHWWITALKASVLEIDPSVRRSIAAIGVSGQQHGFVPLSADGAVLAPVKLWCDTVTTAQCQQITAAFGGAERCVADVGNPILPGYTAPKISWLKQHHRDLYDRLDTILLPHDYINFYLTGEKVMECGDASGTGLLDIRRRCWHSGMLAAVDAERDLAECLPDLVAADAYIGELRPKIATELGLTSGIPVSCGGGDNMMAAIGTANLKQGRLTISLGTSGTLFAYSDSPVIDNTGALAAFCDSTGGWLPLLCTMNCTVATELTRNMLEIPLEELDTRVGRVQPGSAGVMTLPFFQGERTPNLPNGKGCIFGIDNGNYTADNLLRSAMESAVYGLRSGLDAFKQQGCEISSVRLTGGGAKSAIWRQMVADIFNLPVSMQKMEEGAALGAALQACWVHNQGQSGETVKLVEMVDGFLELDEARACEPSPQTVADYSVFYQTYCDHVAAVAPLYDQS